MSESCFSYVNWERNTIGGSLEAKMYKMFESVIGDWDFFRKWELEMVEEGSLVNMWFGIIFIFPNERILKIDNHVF